MSTSRKTVLTITWDEDVSKEEVLKQSRKYALEIQKDLYNTESVRMQVIALHQNNPLWSDEEILETIREFHKKHGRPPLIKEWDNPVNSERRPNRKTVQRHFGSWANAIEAAGYARPRQGRSSLVNELYGVEQHPPSLDEIWREEMLSVGKEKS